MHVQGSPWFVDGPGDGLGLMVDEGVASSGKRRADALAVSASRAARWWIGPVGQRTARNRAGRYRIHATSQANSPSSCRQHLRPLRRPRLPQPQLPADPSADATPGDADPLTPRRPLRQDRRPTAPTSAPTSSCRHPRSTVPPARRRAVASMRGTWRARRNLLTVPARDRGGAGSACRHSLLATEPAASPSPADGVSLRSRSYGPRQGLRSRIRTVSASAAAGRRLHFTARAHASPLSLR